jgi:hypothetical protein
LASIRVKYFVTEEMNTVDPGCIVHLTLSKERDDKEGESFKSFAVKN